MTRRELLRALAALSVSVPLCSTGQSGNLPRIGFLSSEGIRPRLQPFIQGLRDAGYIEGKNIIVDARFAPMGKSDQLDALAAELVTSRVRLIVAPTNNDIEAARRATSTIPIVMVVAGEPIREGFVRSFARPGGNITGQAWAFGPEITAKQVALLAELRPGLTRLAGLVDPGFPITEPYWKAAQAAAASQGIRTTTYEVRVPGDFDHAFQAMQRDRAGAVLVFAGPLMLSQLRRIVDLGMRTRIPQMFGAHSEAVDLGGLVSYAPDVPNSYRLSARYVDRILRGAKPADLPIEQPTQIALRINLRTAKALGISIPQSILLRAEKVIE
jgi:putative ABC transport system substrate-binding protein